MARILAVSSGGGHWEQLMLLKNAFSGHEVYYVNTIDGLAEKSGVASTAVIKDCNRDRMLDSAQCAWEALWLVLRIRPKMVITTGAAPGLLVLIFGRLTGAKTIWIDSVANSEKLSMSGQIARYFSSLHLTQWAHLAAEPQGKTQFLGSVL